MSKGPQATGLTLEQIDADTDSSGQEFDIERVDCGEYRLIRRAARLNEGVVDWLLACLEKDFFVSIESESTDPL